jgi:hypothetical protein
MRLFIEEFQWFFIELSVLPYKILAMVAHLFPFIRKLRKRIHSSSADQCSFLMVGFK